MVPVLYIGSPYHKRYKSKWGAPQLQSDKTECPPEVDPEVAAAVLAEEIQARIVAGCHSVLRDGDWPRYVWGVASFPAEADSVVEVAWEARLVNREQGSYKGYPVSQHRHSNLMPAEVEELLWPDQ